MRDLPLGGVERAGIPPIVCENQVDLRMQYQVETAKKVG
jgi:hypothetical protein